MHRHLKLKKLIKIPFKPLCNGSVVNATSRETSASCSAQVYKTIQVAPNIKARVLYIHNGYTGHSVGKTYHTNLIIIKNNGTSYVDIRNYHITAKTTNGSVCWNIWQSTTKKEYKNHHPGLKENGAPNAMHSMSKELIGVCLSNNYQSKGLLIALIVIVCYGQWLE
ncbi:hypothetical protein M3197_07755 [Sporosarcina aquimarina]|nr:hypothetical protein [Sporosarcina aquimarina]